MRGFQVSHEFIDGTEISGFGGYSMSIAPYNIERLEIIKGPNAILIPGGNPGGQINPITKSPIGKDQAEMTVELAQYYGNDVNFDINRVLNKQDNMAVRFVGAYWKNDYYIKDQYRNGYMIAPSFAVDLSPTVKLIVKGEAVQNRETNGVGLPVDPSVGSNDTAKVLRSLPRDYSFASDQDTRHRSTERLSAELLSTLGDHVNSRLYLMADHVRRLDTGSGTIGLINAGGGSINPNTGLYEPGVNWTVDTSGATAIPTATPVPVTDPSTWIYSRNAGREDIEYSEVHLKNDYAIQYNTDFFKSTTLTGLAANGSKVHRKSYPSASRPSIPANDVDSATFPGWQYPAITPGSSTAGKGLDLTAKSTDLQLFLYETLSGFKDHVQVSGGISRYYGNLTRTDTTGTGIVAALPTAPDYTLTNNAYSFGVVVKPIKPVSLFYSRNTTGGTMPDSIIAGTIDPTSKLAQGAQKEFGIKTSWLDGRLTASFAHYDITQQNVPVTNSDYYTLLAQGKTAEAAALPSTLFVDENSKGWEIEGTFALNKNLTLLANYADGKVRQPVTNVRLRGVPDKSYAFYVDYRFTDGALNGFGVNFGLDYKSDVAGDNATGFTTSKPLPNGTFVAKQPTFLIAGRTLANLGLTYTAKIWTVRLQVSNLFDKDYILAGGSRGGVIVGEPRNIKGSITYKF
jgi:iron complex outermembrane receptor protein